MTDHGIGVFKSPDSALSQRADDLLLPSVRLCDGCCERDRVSFDIALLDDRQRSVSFDGHDVYQHLFLALILQLADYGMFFCISVVTIALAVPVT